MNLENVKSATNLATIQKIVDIQPIPNADAIEVASVLGWKVVVKKNEFKVGDHCVYICIDTILPDQPAFEFLRNKEFRVRTCKFRGQVSQGLALPLLTCHLIPDMPIGTDVTEMIGIKKYEKPVPIQMAGQIEGNFPTHLFPKTDELNLLSYPSALDELNGKDFYVTLKMDGTSCSIFNKDDDFGVCSRNWRLKDDDQNVYWKIAKKFDLVNKLKGRNICVQCEVVAPSIQKGKTGDKELTAYVFDMYDIDNHKYFDFPSMVNLCHELGLVHVPLVKTISVDFADSISIFNNKELTIDKFKNLANKLTYPNTDLPVEGIVIRPVTPCLSNVLDGRLSFKILNEKFLLKYGE